MLEQVVASEQGTDGQQRGTHAEFADERRARLRLELVASRKRTTPSKMLATTSLASWQFAHGRLYAPRKPLGMESPRVALMAARKTHVAAPTPGETAADRRKNRNARKRERRVRHA